ncbi:MAG TPA: thioredoxin family protein [Chitinophagaceae bacterium]|nr:thioredoxin family protein [Chitinophagaceae bacterium]
MKKLFYYDERTVMAAFEEAREKRLPLLIDFWSPGCKGCKKMDDTTYKHPHVISYLQEHYIFVKYNSHNIQPEFKNMYLTSPFLWTPTFMVYAPDGSEMRKVTGYLSPTHFLDELEMGRSMSFLRRAKSDEALLILKQLISATRWHHIRQEAYYWAGVAAFYANRKSLEHLLPFWNALLDQYPGTEWADRADCLEVTV